MIARLRLVALTFVMVLSGCTGAAPGTAAGEPVDVDWDAMRQQARAVLAGAASSASPHRGRAVESATVAPDGTRLAVGFIGEHGPASVPCGADYTAEAVEGPDAVVVLVAMTRNYNGGTCVPGAWPRWAEVTLAAPLGDRKVVELSSGRPVATTVAGTAVLPSDPRWEELRDQARAVLNRSGPPPSWDPWAAQPPGLAIESATVQPGDVRMTVHFTGAVAAADVPCGADYAAEAVERDHAVVIIVLAQPHPTPNAAGEQCPAIGLNRTATLTLSSALGDRKVLEMLRGEPVPVTTP